MHLTVGRTLDGRPLRVPLTPDARLLLVGDPGGGRTSVARHLARWWLSDHDRDAHLDVDWPHEYADLPRSHPGPGDKPATGCHDTDTTLVLVDRSYPGNALHRLATAPGPVVFTCTPNVCLDLADRLLAPSTLILEIATGEEPWQPRLDTPHGAVPFHPTTPGTVDTPCHRWNIGTTRP